MPFAGQEADQDVTPAVHERATERTFRKAYKAILVFLAMSSHLVGYLRASTQRQSLDHQLDALKEQALTQSTSTATRCRAHATTGPASLSSCVPRGSAAPS